MKTIGISEQSHKNLINLKLEERTRNIEEIIEKLIIEYKKLKFIEASDLFKSKLKEKNISFHHILKKSKEVRKEIADEWLH